MVTPLGASLPAFLATKRENAPLRSDLRLLQFLSSYLFLIVTIYSNRFSTKGIDVRAKDVERALPHVHHPNVFWTLQCGDDVWFKAVVIADDGHRARALNHRTAGIDVIPVGIVTRSVPARPPNEVLSYGVKPVTKMAVIIEFIYLKRIMMQSGRPANNA